MPRGTGRTKFARLRLTRMTHESARNVRERLLRYGMGLDGGSRLARAL